MNIVAPLRATLPAIALAGCGLLEDVTSERRVGAIHVNQDPFLPVIVAPDTVRQAVSFAVVVNTFGSSSCTKPDGVDLVATAAMARIVPYDRVQTQGACTADYASRPHQVTLAFASLGAATVRAVGRVGTNLDSVEHVVNVVP
jgi:hypothetical protein